MGIAAVTLRRRELLLAAGLALVFGAGPTVGDIGSCGESVTALDEQTFAISRKNVDCQRCTQCGLSDQTCKNACDPSVPSDVAWPDTCSPLVHDGEVCLRALLAASCSDYASYISDVAPTFPTECDFCHVIPEAGILSGDP